MRSGDVLVLGLVLAAACRSRPPAAEAAGDTLADGSPLAVSFTEVAAAAGIDFRHHSGAGDDYQMPAIMGGGAAVFDADQDGDPDVYLRNGGERVWRPGDPRPGGTVTGRLFVHQPDGRYADGTAAAGFADRGYGMGCAVGDIDNDGDLDLFLSNWGPDVLYRNNGDATFSDVTAAAGVGDPRWSASAVFFDYDRDGWLDLFVTRYLRFDPERVCRLEGGRRDYCGPAQFPGESDLLYHNEGDGRFREVSARAGIVATQYRGLGVVAADWNDDGWPDIYVANDGDPNNLWINQRDGTFTDEGMLAGAALNRQGVAEAGMGVALGDPDGDGDLDLFVTNLIEETNIFYENQGGLSFEDRTPDRGLAVPSVPYTGFGTAFFDADQDGDLDLAVVNGAVKLRPVPLLPPGAGPQAGYAEPNQLYANDGAGHFRDASAQAGDFGGSLQVNRGLVPFDLEGDGDLDLLVTAIDAPARVYRNDRGDLDTETGERAGNWLVVRAVDPSLRRDALGAMVEIETATRRFVVPVIPPAGYLTSGEARAHVGLGRENRVLGAVVRWPSGERERFAVPLVNRAVTLERGSGEPAT